MIKQKLLSLMPTEEIVTDVNKRLEEQRGLVKAGKSFVSHLSINRFLRNKLADFDIEERLDLFKVLKSTNFVINENGLYCNEITIQSLASIVEEKFNLESMYEVDNLYIENLLNGRGDITIEVINHHFDESVSFADILQRFVFHTRGMCVEDTPNLMVMLTAKKALLGSYLAEINVQSLLNGQREIYDISTLM